MPIPPSKKRQGKKPVKKKSKSRKVARSYGRTVDTKGNILETMTYDEFVAAGRLTSKKD